MHTIHARKRCQQRAIRQDTIDILLAFGQCRRRNNADVYFMDHRARRTAQRALGRKAFAKLADRLNCYLVLSDEGHLITAAKRRHKLKFR